MPKPLSLVGGVNFRDIGGLPAAGGVTRHRTIFRSGLLSRLTPEDREQIDSLGIRIICDFRGPLEQTSEPYRWLPAGARMADWGASSSGDITALREVLTSESSSGDARLVMLDLYRNLSERHADRYALAFKALAAGDVPAILACTAGKDRTGTAIALLLALIGVTNEAIVDNYALSEKVYDFPAHFLADAARAEQDGNEASPILGLVRRVGIDVLKPILASNPDYIVACLTSVAARYGSVANYGRERLGLSDAEIGQLQHFLLE